MAVLAPLAPAGAVLCAGPQALICALVAVGAAGITYLAVRKADNTASTSLSTSTVTTQACSTCNGPKCNQHNQNIKKYRDELAQRELDLKIDKFDLYNKARSVGSPMTLPTGERIGSWDGHLQQFRQKQAALRNEVTKARKANCRIGTPDADRWGSKDPPSRPDRLYHNR